jgi:hypothetical protein
LLPRGVFSEPFSGLSRGGSSISDSISNDSHGPVQTYCYQAVRTSAINPAPGVDCFSVSPASGTFTRVFRSSSSSSSSSDDANGDSDGDGEAEDGHRHRRHRSTGYAIPGLWDGHGHLLQYGEFLHSADLFGARSPAEVRRRLRGYLARQRRDRPGVGGRHEWVRGIGWDQMLLGGMPTAAGISLSFFFFFYSLSLAPAFWLAWSVKGEYFGWIFCWNGSILLTERVSMVGYAGGG